MESSPHDESFSQNNGRQRRNAVILRSSSASADISKIGNAPGSKWQPVFCDNDLSQGTRWHDFWSDRVYEDGRCVSVPLRLAHIPVFVRHGAVIETREDTQYAGAPAQVRQNIYD